MSESSIVYLNHESTTIQLSNGCAFKVFGSPYSPARGKWAFGYEPDQGYDLWNKIPSDTDIVLTHTPPFSHCDQSSNRGSAGCAHLHRALCAVRPRLSVCGHVHEGRGYERVRWKAVDNTENFEEFHTIHGTLPPLGSKKQALVDLTGTKETSQLDNDGFLALATAPEKSTDGSRNRKIETCIANAAIMASNWPHKGGKKFNSPLVVCLDMPSTKEAEST